MCLPEGGRGGGGRGEEGSKEEAVGTRPEMPAQLGPKCVSAHSSEKAANP